VCVPPAKGTPHTHEAKSPQRTRIRVVIAGPTSQSESSEVEARKHTARAHLGCLLDTLGHSLSPYNLWHWFFFKRLFRTAAARAKGARGVACREDGDRFTAQK